MAKTHTLLIALALTSTSLAQEPITVPLHFEKKIESESHGFVPLYEYGHDGKVMHEGKALDITAPSLAKDTESAYGFIYFTGQPNGSIDREILFLVTDYKESNPRFYVDLNNNLDFTDDKSAVIKESASDKFIMTLQAAVDPKRIFTVRLGFFRDDSQVKEYPEITEQYAEILRGYIQRMGGTPVAPEHWFADQQLNVRSASVNIEGWSFQIGVFDVDCDGSYDRLGEDQILVGKFEGKYLSRSKSRGATPLTEETLIRAGEQVFEVLKVDPAGGFIQIVPSDKAYTRLAVGASIPPNALVFLSGGRSPLTSLVKPGKFMLIDFWGHWCKGCILALPEIKSAASELEEVLTIVSLHNGDHDQARTIIENEALSWIHAEASTELTEAFLVDRWPYYVLVDGEGRILMLDTSLAEALQFVRSMFPEEK